MPPAPGGVLPRERKGPQIRYNQGVYSSVIQPLQMFRQTGGLIISGHSVDGAVNLDPVSMGKSHCPGQLLRGKVPGKSSHAEIRTRQIHSVRAVENRHFQPLHIPRRGQQLRFSALIRHTDRC